MSMDKLFLKQQEELERQQLALYDQAKSITEDDNKATIGGCEYTLKPDICHKERLAFLQYSNDIASRVKNFDFETMEKMLSKVVMFDGMLMDRLPKHWDKNKGYESYINIMPLVLQYPFLEEKHMSLKSQFEK